jgi:hypothetical protein
MTNFAYRRTRIGRVGFDPVEEPSGLAAIIKTEDSRIHSSLVAPAATGTFFANIHRQCKQAFKKVVHIKVLAKIALTVKITTRISARFSQFASIFCHSVLPAIGTAILGPIFERNVPAPVQSAAAAALCAGQWIERDTKDGINGTKTTNDTR